MRLKTRISGIREPEPLLDLGNKVSCFDAFASLFHKKITTGKVILDSRSCLRFRVRTIFRERETASRSAKPQAITDWVTPMNDPPRKVALVTGAATGIGRATAVRFAQHGFAVTINYSRSEQDAHQTLQ